MAIRASAQQPATGGSPEGVRLPTDYEAGLVIRPCLPSIPGILGIGPDQCIAAHAPHGPIKEHLHHHLPHLHIRYGFELPAQTLSGIERISPAVMMMIRADQRVDCNPIFVARGEGAEGITLHIDGEEVHWVHSDEAGAQATELFTPPDARRRMGSTGRAST